MEYEPVFERCRISSEVWLYKKRVDDVTTLKDQRIVDLWWCWCVEILANKKKKKLIDLYCKKNKQKQE